MWCLMRVTAPLVKTSFLRLFLRRSTSSHATELRELKEECDSFWRGREDMFVFVCCRFVARNLLVENPQPSCIA